MGEFTTEGDANDENARNDESTDNQQRHQRQTPPLHHSASSVQPRVQPPNPAFHKQNSVFARRQGHPPPGIHGNQPPPVSPRRPKLPPKKPTITPPLSQQQQQQVPHQHPVPSHPRQHIPTEKRLAGLWPGPQIQQQSSTENPTASSRRKVGSFSDVVSKKNKNSEENSGDSSGSTNLLQPRIARSVSAESQTDTPTQRPERSLSHGSPPPLPPMPSNIAFVASQQLSITPSFLETLNVAIGNPTKPATPTEKEEEGGQPGEEGEEESTEGEGEGEGEEEGGDEEEEKIESEEEEPSEEESEEETTSSGDEIDTRFGQSIKMAFKGWSGGGSIGSSTTTSGQSILSNLLSWTKKGTPTPVYGSTLEVLMGMQQEQWPTLEIPRILYVLTNKLISLNAGETEGIFRISGDVQKLNDFKDQINTGDYDIDCTDIHVVAGLLKVWFRELPEPLISFTVYDQFIQNAEDGDTLLSLVRNQLPHVNSRVLLFILQFLCDLSKKEFSEQTKMTDNNLAMVFSPCLLRSPKTAIMMFNSAKETKAILNLIRAMKKENNDLTEEEMMRINEEKKEEKERVNESKSHFRNNLLNKYG
eukprot:CAMPEP_0174257586 /NCGR_PEP_ID=MMETSP0439-20130205/6704_1 /TAXON_ID=0 /ORGANISM="Stereomyxa ramosa, Strain Chinc5" /LENGTH=587 /DNA_ID=CAMNT_0015340741 /DNA_START=1095 /DNA_END=2858 /DNA_ORIENTATION=-